MDVIEAGFPIASDADAEAVHLVATNIRRPIIAALARCMPGDIERAALSLKPAERSRIHTFLATSDLHLTRKLRMTREACLQTAVDGVRLARRYTDDVQFSAEDATRSDLDFLCRVIEAVIEAGCTDREPARHGRLFHAGGNWRVLRAGTGEGAQRRQGGLQRALSR